MQLSTHLEPANRRAPGRRLPYLPGLDGIRALALFGVLGFHAGVSWLSGGYLPVTAFFVLSGFLITALLLRERDLDGAVDLRAFWGRRARRLVPAMLVAVALVGTYSLVAVERESPGLVGDAFSALTWVTNWRFIIAGTGYADAWSDPSPLQHLWSLGVEEQFYLLMPLLAAGCLALGRGRRRWLVVATLGLATASTLTMALLHEPGKDAVRVYFGTDTRAAELLVGVALALVLVRPTGLVRLTGFGRGLLDGAGLAALAATIAVWCTVQQMDQRLFEGGFVGVALLAAVVVAAASQPGTVTARILGLRPLVAVGRISYGAYVLHWPLFLWLSEARTGLDGNTLIALRLFATLGLAALSYRFIERPIQLGRLPTRAGQLGWLNASIGLTAMIVAVTAALPASSVTLRSIDAPAAAALVGQAPAAGSAAGADGVTVDAVASSTPPDTSTPTAPPTSAGAAPDTAPPATDAAPAPTVPPPPVRVLVVGDSFAQNLATGLALVSEGSGALIVQDATRLGCGLVRGGQVRWPDGRVLDAPPPCESTRPEWQAAVASFAPDVVVVQAGVSEVFDRRFDDWGDFRSPGDPLYDDWITGEYRAGADALGAAPAVVWTTVPCVDWNPDLPNHFDQSTGDARITYHRSTVIADLARTRDVIVADLYSQVCPGGRFSDTVAGVGGARPDGAHLSDEAARALAEQWLMPIVLSAAGRGS